MTTLASVFVSLLVDLTHPSDNHVGVLYLSLVAKRRQQG